MRSRGGISVGVVAVVIMATVAVVRVPIAAQDAPRCDGRVATIVGTAGDDVLFGTEGDDVIVGGGGNDVIRAFGGNDHLCGDNGRDRLFGGRGDDTLLGGKKNDILKGDQGRDHLLGNQGRDRLIGGGGRDILEGGSGFPDRLVGKGGVDTCTDPQVQTFVESCELPPPTTVPPAPESARYRVTLVLEWSPTTHPTTLPPGWHTSPAVLAAHATAGQMVPIGTIASPGIESMAEIGQTSLLLNELAADQTVGGVDTGRRVDGTGTDVLEVDTTQGTPLLSLVTMLAPSPDWFTGVADVPVFENGAWLERLEMDVTPWDAGTDSGTDFTSGNVDTQPRGVISGPVNPSYMAAATEGRFGYVVIERIV
ncbi:MAG: spondin domain-containing protein [Acidimicrobiia bacterium]|nr:spondin domain-containing protein [Acidimicrobiia bacterium]